MSREDSSVDLKISFDPGSPGAMVELVKDLVAMANSGGGEIRIGESEDSTPGVDSALLPVLDGAKISDQVNRYISPSRAEVSHKVRSLQAGRVVISLKIAGAGRYPFIFSSQAQYGSRGKTKSVFREGDIYIRHGDKSERASYGDLAAIIDRAVEDERASTLRQVEKCMKQLVGLPQGFDPVLLAQTPSGDIIGSSGALLDFAVQRRKEGDRGAVLDGTALLSSFLTLQETELTMDRLSMLIRSALRRPPTLYFWLQMVERDQLHLVEDVLLTTLTDADRDTSDASKTVLEVASLIASDSVLNEIVEEMRQSRNKHSRSAAGEWKGREDARREFLSRVESATVGGVEVKALDTEDVHQRARDLAQEIIEGQSRSMVFHLLSSLAMENLGRVVYQRRRM